MRSIDFFLDTLPIRGLLQKHARAFTLIEVLLAIAIIGTLSAVAVPTYSNIIEDKKVSRAIVDIVEIEAAISRFQAEQGIPPNTLAAAGIPAKLDPWGNPYMYERLAGLTKAEQDGKCRWNKFEKPLNDDFDLYSMGKDGETKSLSVNRDYLTESD